MKFINNQTFRFLLFFSLAVFAYYILIELIYSLYVIPQELTTKKIRIRFHSRIIETAILGYTYLVMLMISQRHLFSFVVVKMLYLIFIFSSVMKISYLGNPIFPIDFKQVDDLIRTKEVFFQFLPMIIIVTVLVAFISKKLYAWTKREKKSWMVWTINFTLLISPILFLSFEKHLAESYLREKKIFLRKNADQVKKSIQSGMLNYFIQSTLFTGQYPKPKNYDAKKVFSIIKKHKLYPQDYINKGANSPSNIIFILVESLTDPHEMGWSSNKKVLKNFKKYQQVNGEYSLISPVLGGKSINAEFETLTGMSCIFTPPSSLPFREAVSRNVPSIPNTLKNFGFFSTAIQQVKMNGFGYERIFEYLGFDKTISMKDISDIEKDHLNRYSSVEALFNQIIQVADSQQKSFIYAFSNTTHSPWNEDDFPNSTLKLLPSNEISNRGRKVINGYINAVNDFDVALEKLISQYEGSDKKTLIIVAGDHQPHHQEYRRKNFTGQENYAELILKEYKVPMLIWSNYEIETPDEKLHSMNFLPAILFSTANIEADGLIKLSSKLKIETPVFSKIMAASNSLIKNNEGLYNDLILDYEMLQYDVLYGNNYQQDFNEKVRTKNNE